jgi:subtilisin family serine protease
MRRLHILARVGLLISLISLSALAGDWIVQVKDSSQLKNLAQQYGATSVVTLHQGTNLYKFSLPSGPAGLQLAAALRSDSHVKSMVPDQLVGLPKPSGATAHTLSSLPTNCNAFSLPGAPPKFSGPTPKGYDMYLHQASNCIVSAPGTWQKSFNAYGFHSVKVAVIDTGVDFSNPVLSGSKLGAVDVTGANDPAGVLTQETSPMVDQETSPMVDQETSPMVDQETSPMVDSANTIILNLYQETSPMVDQETSPMVDQAGNKLPTAFGHGTMVAGIIHLVAPNAQISSIKAFTNDGRASLSTLILGIGVAMDQGVDVINASWSLTATTDPLATVIAAAQAQGIIIVASVANNGANEIVYPAASQNVIGVGCTDNSDKRCSFSDYGPVVDLAAPGYGITSTFPTSYVANGNTHSLSGFATGWGTSFSTPYVAGAVALLRSLNDNMGVVSATGYINHADPLSPSLGLGAGRLDVFAAYTAAAQFGFK